MIQQRAHLKHLFFCMVFLAHSWNYAAEIIKGEGAPLFASFPFVVGANTISAVTGSFFVGAAEPVAGNNGAISYAPLTANPDFNKFFGITPETVRLNNQIDQPNPLHGQQIDLLAMSSGSLAAVSAAEPEVIYLLRSFNNLDTLSVLSTTTINDALQEQTAGVVALTSNAPASIMAGHNVIFAAVKKNGGTFGEIGGGIAATMLSALGEDNETVPQFLDVLDTVSGVCQGNRAFPVDNHLTTTTDPNVLDVMQGIQELVPDVVDLHWSEELRRLYVAVQVTTQNGIGPAQGARALAVGCFSDKKLTFQAIGPDDIFTGNNKIVGALGANEAVSLHKVRTMHTTTDLDYLVVVGGNGAPADTVSDVYALPLINNARSAAHGTLAVPVPVNSFNNRSPFTFKGRAFKAPVASAANATTDTNLAALVGGGQLFAPIQDIQVVGDTVFVSTTTCGDNTEAGIFSSQALFDSAGVIKRWTTWQRAGGTAANMFGFALDRNSGVMWFMPALDAASVTTVKRTMWGNQEDGTTGWLVALAKQAFPQDLGGVQTLIDVPHITPGLTTTLGQRLSLLIATGFGKVVISQSGGDNDQAIFVPNTSVGIDFFSSTDGTLTNFMTDQHTVLEISGGELEELGPIVTAEVGTDGQDGWFFVGGTGGVAVLTRADGTGWNGATGLQKLFGGLDDQMAFRVLGDYSNVRKLMADENYLYVLTNERFDRIELSAAAIAQGASIPVTTLATPSLMGLRSATSFSDITISGPFALLATSQGLFRVGNGRDIRTATNSVEATWTEVIVNDSLGPVTRFSSATVTGLERDFGMMGQLYVLATSVSLHSSRMYRFCVNVENNMVTDTTLQCINDLFIKDVPTFFINFADYRNYFVTDGSLSFHSRSRYQASGPVLKVIPSPIVTGNRFIGGASKTIPLAFDTSARCMNRIIKSSASGSWLVSGDLGLNVNE